MSEDHSIDDVTLWSHFRMITPELLSQFLYEKGVEIVSCPMCKKADMSIPKATEKIDDRDITYVHPSRVDAFGFEPRSSLLQYHYRLICKNCGFESRFSVHPIMLWLLGREKK